MADESEDGNISHISTSLKYHNAIGTIPNSDGRHQLKNHANQTEVADLHVWQLWPAATIQYMRDIQGENPGILG
jgi:hypothetical protein